MASKVQLCNLALSRLGASTITSLTDNTTEAKLCNTFFSDIADEVMSTGSWTSTIARVELARTSNTPAFEYTYEFQLPVDPQVLKVLNLNEDVPSIQYRIEGDKLLTDCSAIKIRYVSRLVDTEDWDIFLQKSFVARLSSELAYALTGDNKKAELEFKRYEAFLLEGLAQDGQQGSKEMISSNDLTKIRL